MDAYDGDGYEFSVRSEDGARLLVHVTRSALLTLDASQGLSQFSVLARETSFLRQIALAECARSGGVHLTIDEALVQKWLDHQHLH